MTVRKKVSGFEEVTRVYTECCNPTPSACRVLEEPMLLLPHLDADK